MRTATGSEEIDEAWTSFLINANGVFAKLEQGAKDNPQSRQWFGGEKRARKDDEMMNYLHQARNADEHALQEVTFRAHDSLGIGLNPGFGSLVINQLIISGGEVIKADVDNPAALRVTRTPGTVTLKRVFDDRSDRWYEVPTTHAGAPIADSTPVAIAELAVAYLDRVIAEAESRAA